jgi:threonine/homoserine/homoserine lactone efflux protein
MTTVLLIVTGFVLSLVGTLPPGMINITVAMTTLRKGFMAGATVAVGAVCVEWLQAFVSVKFSDILTSNAHFHTTLQLLALLIFSALAVYYLFLAPDTVPSSDGSRGSRTDFAKGMAVSAANVLAFPYWIFYGTYLGARGWLDGSLSDVVIFASSTSAGTCTALLSYALLSRQILRKVKDVVRVTNRIVGIIFLILTLLEAINLLW